MYLLRSTHLLSVVLIQALHTHKCKVIIWFCNSKESTLMPYFMIWHLVERQNMGPDFCFRFQQFPQIYIFICLIRYRALVWFAFKSRNVRLLMSSTELLRGYIIRQSYGQFPVIFFIWAVIIYGGKSKLVTAAYLLFRPSGHHSSKNFWHKLDVNCVKPKWYISLSVSGWVAKLFTKNQPSPELWI